MNTIFAAQKCSVPIDVCRLSPSDSLFLSQASHLSRGTLVNLHSHDELIHTLLGVFLVPVALRRVLCLPAKEQTDLRASCFCHSRTIDSGYVCSICLSSEFFDGVC